MTTIYIGGQDRPIRIEEGTCKLYFQLAKDLIDEAALDITDENIPAGVVALFTLVLQSGARWEENEIMGYPMVYDWLRNSTMEDIIKALVVIGKAAKSWNPEN